MNIFNIDIIESCFVKEPIILEPNERVQTFSDTYNSSVHVEMDVLHRDWKMIILDLRQKVL